MNIKGVWNTCQAVIPHMLYQGKGSIVIASSVIGDIVADGSEAAYAMSKAALVDLTKCLAVESNPENPEQAIQDIAVNVPMKRLAKPKDVGELFAFLGSDEASYITGGQFVIDGGTTLPETMSMGTN